MVQLRFPRIVLWISICAIILFPLYVGVVLYPSFEEVLTENTSAEAVRIATILSSILIEEQTNGRELKVPASFSLHLRDLQKDTRILKVKIFTPSGRIVYSTDPKEIGRMNEEEYFQGIIRSGGSRAQEIERNEPTLEKQVMAADVVETYVPIMRDNATIGVFEIYYDITAEKQRLDGLIRRSAGYLFLFALLLLIAVVVSTWKAERTLRERRKVEEALVASEERYRTLFEHAGDAIFILEATGPDAGKIVAANKAAAIMHGYSVGKLLTMKITELDTPDAAEGASETFGRILEGEWVNLELAHSRSDGSVFPVEVSAGLMNVGDRKYVLAFDRDITARRDVEQGRERVIAELQQALENIRTLRGLLPICASCKKIRDDKGYWNQIESYISSHTAAEFSHSLCPDCMQKLYPQFQPKTTDRNEP